MILGVTLFSNFVSLLDLYKSLLVGLSSKDKYFWISSILGSLLLSLEAWSDPLSSIVDLFVEFMPTLSCLCRDLDLYDSVESYRKLFIPWCILCGIFELSMDLSLSEWFRYFLIFASEGYCDKRMFGCLYNKLELYVFNEDPPSRDFYCEHCSQHRYYRS